MNGNDDGAGRANEENRDAGRLANSLRFEQEKNKILLDQVISLEDALVNRQMAEFDAVISDDTREFWREQLLSNREQAEGALAEMVHLKGSDGERKTVDRGPKTDDSGRKAEDRGQRRRPLHNRMTARPRARGSDGGPAAESESAHGRAVKIRNRAHELCKVEGIPFSTAFRRAEREASAE